MTSSCTHSYDIVSRGGRRVTRCMAIGVGPTAAAARADLGRALTRAWDRALGRGCTISWGLGAGYVEITADLRRGDDGRVRRVRLTEGGARQAVRWLGYKYGGGRL